MKTRLKVTSRQAAGPGGPHPGPWGSEAPAPISGSHRGRSENYDFVDELFLIFWCHHSSGNVLETKNPSPESCTRAERSLMGRDTHTDVHVPFCTHLTPIS